MVYRRLCYDGNRAKSRMEIIRQGEKGSTAVSDTTSAIRYIDGS